MITTATVLAAWQGVLGTPSVERLGYHGDRVWEVRSEDGREYILKRARPLDQDDLRLRLACEYRVLCYAQAAGVPLALPIVTDDGRLYVADADDLFSLSPRLPGGDQFPESRAEAAQVYSRVGAAIGRLHLALAQCPYQIPFREMDLFYQLKKDSWPQLRAADEPLARKVDPLLPGIAAAFTDLPHQLIHGDCHDGNMLLHEGRVSGFIDLELLPTGARLHDLARYLGNRILWAIEDPDARGPAFWSLVGALLSGYDTVNTLTARERAALVPAILIREIDNADWCLGQGDTTSSYVTGTIRTAHWIADNYDAFCQQFSPAP